MTSEIRTNISCRVGPTLGKSAVLNWPVTFAIMNRLASTTGFDSHYSGLQRIRWRFSASEFDRRLIFAGLLLSGFVRNYWMGDSGLSTTSSRYCGYHWWLRGRTTRRCRRRTHQFLIPLHWSRSCCGAASIIIFNNYWCYRMKWTWVGKWRSTTKKSRRTYSHWKLVLHDRIVWACLDNWCILGYHKRKQW